MAVPKKLVIVPNAATRELWRIAESGETDDLEAVLSRAEINARNEHGMTALMRAARHGRVQMVRTLLEHGADPNVARSDKFTALSLAAFFGHTEIVEILLNHGARTDVATRFGTSPHMWAKARSFGDVVRCIEKVGEQRKPAPPALAPPAVAEAAPKEAKPATVEVRTLKDPPEIWDLVHEAPQHFNARSAFITRIRSIRMGFLLRAAAVLLVVAAGTLAVLSWKSTLPPSSVSKADTPPQQIDSAPVIPVSNPAPVTPAVIEPENSGVASATTDTPVETQQTRASVNRRSRPVARSRSTDINLPSVNVIETAPAPAPPLIVSKPESRNE
ncbi:MAG TPA: ankyrin repeat domain-containing protein, partial [Pyrinomonadaceae bacterium]|nr:ankyrin repeat domain-containing protein [Pyrinomonadaceae bacterium]